jgi:hypothetical protein
MTGHRDTETQSFLVFSLKATLIIVGVVVGTVYVLVRVLVPYT